MFRLPRFAFCNAPFLPFPHAPPIPQVNGTQVMMLRYVLPEGVAGEPVCFPLQAPEFVRTGCELVSPLTTTVLQGDMSYDWQVRAATATLPYVRLRIHHSYIHTFTMTLFCKY